MTPTQLKLLTFIREFIAANGFAPSYREMADFMDVKSNSSLKRMVDILVANGYLCCTGHGFSRNLALPMPNLHSVPTAVLTAEIERRKADHG